MQMQDPTKVFQVQIEFWVLTLFRFSNSKYCCLEIDFNFKRIFFEMAFLADLLGKITEVLKGCAFENW